jgi:hypothetical protein
VIAADVEELVVNYLAQSFPNVGIDMPATPPLPFYLVNNLTAPSDWVTECNTVSIHVFAANRTDASIAARAMHNLMNPWVLNPKVTFTLSTGSANVDRVQIVEKPCYRPYENPNLQRYCGRYRIDLRLNQTS